MEEPLQLNVKEILKNRLPESKRNLIPDFALTAIEKLIHQNDLNDILRYCHPHEGSAFSEKVIEYLGIQVEVEGLDRLKRRVR